MPMGPGKYDDLCTEAREKVNASAVLMIVFGGSRGNGFSCQTTDLVTLAMLPDILRATAKEIEQSGGQG